MQTQITRRCVIEEKTEELGEKPLRHPPSGNRSTRQSVGIHGLAREPPSLIYLLYLSPPSSYSNKASQNCVLSSFPDPAIRLIASTKAWLLSMLPSNTKSSLDTLKGCGKCLGYQPLNGMEIERQEQRKSTSKCVEICGYNCKVEFYQPSCWLYSVPNLFVFQQLVTLYLCGNHVRVVYERM